MRDMCVGSTSLGQWKKTGQEESQQSHSTGSCWWPSVRAIARATTSPNPCLVIGVGFPKESPDLRCGGIVSEPSASCLRGWGVFVSTLYRGSVTPWSLSMLEKKKVSGWGARHDQGICSVTSFCLLDITPLLKTVQTPRAIIIPPAFPPLLLGLIPFSILTTFSFFSFTTRTKETFSWMEYLYFWEVRQWSATNVSRIETVQLPGFHLHGYKSIMH